VKHPGILLPLLLALAGCAGGPAPGPEQRPHPELRQAEAAARAGRYREAIDAYRQAAEQGEEEVASAALFQAAYLLAYYENPRRDYAQALQGFERYLKRYPQGSLFRQARNWQAILRTILEQRAEVERLNAAIEELKKIDIKHEEKRKL